MRMSRWLSDLRLSNRSVRKSRPHKPRYIRTRHQGNSKFRPVLLLAVINRKSFAKLRRRGTHNVVQIRIVRRFSLKNLNTDRAFFDLIRRAIQRLLNDVSQKRNRPLARAKRMVSNQQIKLFTDPSRAYFDVRSILDFDLDHGNSSDSDSSIQVHCSARVNRVRHITPTVSLF